MVQLMKRCLRKLVGKAKLPYEELQTSLTEVEAILNSQPLTYISASDLDEPLTPHLILGRRLLSLPDNLCKAVSDLDYNTTSRVILNKRMRMRYLQTVLEQFWRCWKKEYLLELREVHRYHKGKLGAKQIAIGDVVTVHEDTQRGMWRIGIVEETLVSKDKEIRGAVVRVKAGKGASSFLRRPIQQLYPLKVQHESPLQIVLLKSLSRVIVNRKLLRRREITQMRRMYLLLILQKTPSIKTPLISRRIHCLLSLKSLRSIANHQGHPFLRILAVVQQQRHRIGSLLN